MTLIETPKEHCTGVNSWNVKEFAKFAVRFAANSSGVTNAYKSEADGTPAAVILAKTSVSISMEDAFSPFNSADDLEQGFAAEAVQAKTAASPAQPKEPFRRCCIFHSVDPVDEFHLVSQTGDMLLTAKFLRREHRIEFYLPEEEKRLALQSESCMRRRGVPAFTTTHSEHNDNYVVTQTCCDHCVQRPRHLSCKFLGKAQQMAFIQHSRRKVGPHALLHYVDVRIPSLVADTESMVWCPVTLGRDLSDKFPAQGGTPRRTRSGQSLGDHVRRTRSGQSLGSYSSSQGCRDNGTKSQPLGSYSSSQGCRDDGTKSLPLGSYSSSHCCRDRSEEELQEGPETEELQEEPDALQLRTKMPVWDDTVDSLVLNFNDRTVQSSPMNFMLCTADQSQRVVMQHAKLSANTYCLDFRHPLSTAQAFAIALSSLKWD